jgi:hypothetical protein
MLPCTGVQARLLMFRRAFGNGRSASQVIGTRSLPHEGTERHLAQYAREEYAVRSLKYTWTGPCASITGCLDNDQRCSSCGLLIEVLTRAAAEP